MHKVFNSVFAKYFFESSVHSEPTYSQISSFSSIKIPSTTKQKQFINISPLQNDFAITI